MFFGVSQLPQFQNVEIPLRELKNLKTKKGRDETGLFIVEGEKFVQEIPSNWRIVSYIAAEHYASAHNLSIYEKRTKCQVVRDSIFQNISDTKTPQGILAVCEKRSFTLSDSLLNPTTQKDGFFLLGENLNDPGNIGALIRTAAAAGAKAVILTAGSGDIYNPKVLRAAAGAALRIPVIENTDLVETITTFQKHTIPTYAAHPRGSVLPYELNLQQNFCLLVGNESHGISANAAAIASTLVTLPMANSTESLNASIAGSILLYEAVRQRLGATQ